MKNSFSNELNIAKELAYKASKNIMEIYALNFDINYKDDDTPVTKADIEASKIISDGILSVFPSHSILSEEEADDFSRLENDWCWIIDPIDGTKEFVKKSDEFVISIALAYKGSLVMGLIYAPVYDELYYATAGNGAFLQKDGIMRRIHVSERTTGIRVLRSRSHASQKYNDIIAANASRISRVTNMGSALKACRIAAGEYDVYYSYGKTMIWDTAAIDLIVREAGGLFSQLDGTPINYVDEDIQNRKGFYAVNRAENLLHINP